MKALDLFSGAGGMSLGAKRAGISVRLSVECDQYAAETYAYNFPEAKVFQGDIREFQGEMLEFNPDIVFGGPPCQGFSTSNQKTRSKNNPTNWLFEEYLRIVSEVHPKWVVIENVKGLLETEGKLFFDAIIGGLTDLNYDVKFQVLNALHYGVPQNRSRLFIVGVHKGGKFVFPKSKESPVITVSEAIGDLPVLRNGACVDYVKYRHNDVSDYVKKLRNGQEGCANHLVTKNGKQVINRYRHIPQGGNWEDIPGRLMGNYKDRTRCHTGIYHRLRADSPSVVIGNYRKNMLIHPEQNRGLSVREAARIQSFPDDFVFKGSIGFQQQQVGNAVPPMLAEAVFKQISR